MSATALALDALSWLLTYALHSTLLLCAAWWFCSRERLRSERVREGVWKLALVGGILTSGLQSVLGLEPGGGRFAIEEGVSVAQTPGLPASDPRASGDALDAGAAEAPSPNLDAWQDPAGPTADSWEHAREAPEEPEVSLLGALAHAPQAAQDAAFFEREIAPASLSSVRTPSPWARLASLSWTDWALVGWASGGAVLLILLAVAGLRLRDHLAGRKRLREGPLIDRLAALRRTAGIRRPVRLMVSPRIQTPIALGTLWPEICVPPRALTELTPEMQDAMLAHELAHVARFDPLWLGICRWIETLLFFQPLNQVARRRLAEGAEFLCDDRAVRWTGDAISLARCLAEVAAWLSGESRSLAPARSLCGMAERRSRLSERVTRILERRSESEALGRGLLPIGAGFLGSFALLAPGFAREVTVPSEPLNEHELTLPEESAPEPELDVAFAEPPTPRSPLQALVLELEGGLVGLEHELAQLTRSTAGLEVPEPLARRLKSVEERAARMRLKKQRIDSLLERLLGGDAASGIGPSEEP